MRESRLEDSVVNLMAGLRVSASEFIRPGRPMSTALHWKVLENRIAPSYDGAYGDSAS